jgi:hypothetical protein
MPVNSIRFYRSSEKVMDCLPVTKPVFLLVTNIVRIVKMKYPDVVFGNVGEIIGNLSIHSMINQLKLHCIVAIKHVSS